MSQPSKERTTQPCERCGGQMKPKLVLRPGYYGSPDFPGETGIEAGCTISEGSGDVVMGYTCGNCSWTVAPQPKVMETHNSPPVPTDKERADNHKALPKHRADRFRLMFGQRF